MQEYKELYAGNGVKLFGAYEEYGAYLFRVELYGFTPSGLNCGYSGTAPFYFTPNAEEYCKKLRHMYDSLSGECLIQDCEFGNTLKLYFKSRQLMLDGYFYDSTQQLKFSAEVDQTILPRIINLLRSTKPILTIYTY